jgi:Na+/melibiose symporter-like transporter
MGIRLTVSVYPAVCLCVVVGCLLFYRITRSVNEQMATELEERRRSYRGGGVAAPGTVVGAGGSLAIVE